MLADGVFQVIEIEKAEAYVKSSLNIVEYPPEPYEKIVVIATISEGVSRARISRHRWAEIMPMWNMSKKGFEELYNRLPGPKPSFDYVWRWSGGNPDVLRRLYLSKWSPDVVILRIIETRSSENS